MTAATLLARHLVRASIGSRMQNLATSQQWLVLDVRCRCPPGTAFTWS
ncbi:hypothetical protein ACWDZ8_33410 [Streptomyces sp. NPDC003233]